MNNLQFLFCVGVLSLCCSKVVFSQYWGYYGGNYGGCGMYNYCGSSDYQIPTYCYIDGCKSFYRQRLYTYCDWGCGGGASGYGTSEPATKKTYEDIKDDKNNNNNKIEKTSSKDEKDTKLDSITNTQLKDTGKDCKSAEIVSTKSDKEKDVVTLKGLGILKNMHKDSMNNVKDLTALKSLVSILKSIRTSDSEKNANKPIIINNDDYNDGNDADNDDDDDDNYDDDDDDEDFETNDCKQQPNLFPFECNPFIGTRSNITYRYIPKKLWNTINSKAGFISYKKDKKIIDKMFKDLTRLFPWVTFSRSASWAEANIKFNTEPNNKELDIAKTDTISGIIVLPSSIWNTFYSNLYIISIREMFRLFGNLGDNEGVKENTIMKLTDTVPSYKDIQTTAYVRFKDQYQTNIISESEFEQIISEIKQYLLKI